VKLSYRLIILGKAGVLVSEFQLTENALAQPGTFVAMIQQSVNDVEEGTSEWRCRVPWLDVCVLSRARHSPAWETPRTSLYFALRRASLPSPGMFDRLALCVGEDPTGSGSSFS
jgi:hypothetical protein